MRDRAPVNTRPLGKCPFYIRACCISYFLNRVGVKSVTPVFDTIHVFMECDLHYQYESKIRLEEPDYKSHAGLQLHSMVESVGMHQGSVRGVSTHPCVLGAWWRLCEGIQTEAIWRTSPQSSSAKSWIHSFYGTWEVCASDLYFGGRRHFGIYCVWKVAGAKCIYSCAELPYFGSSHYNVFPVNAAEQRGWYQCALGECLTPAFQYYSQTGMNDWVVARTFHPRVQGSTDF